MSLNIRGKACQCESQARFVEGTKNQSSRHKTTSTVSYYDCLIFKTFSKCHEHILGCMRRVIRHQIVGLFRFLLCSDNCYLELCFNFSMSTLSTWRSPAIVDALSSWESVFCCNSSSSSVVHGKASCQCLEL